MTVEASLVMPVFIMAMVAIAYMGNMILCQDKVQWALTRVANEASIENAIKGTASNKSTVYYRAKMNAYLSAVPLRLSLAESDMSGKNEEIKVTATYYMRVPFADFFNLRCRFRQTVHTRAFVGVDDRSNQDKEECNVYIAPTGSVYHKNKDCTYLKLTISEYLYEDVAALRNTSGGKYKPCDVCCSDHIVQKNEPVIITNYGDRYHITRGCSGIKRSISEISINNVGKRSPCSKCGR